MNKTAKAAHTVSEVLIFTDKLFFCNAGSRGVSTKQLTFRQKLFEITRRRQMKEASECSDIDATAYLTDEEFDALIKEAESLK